MAIRKIGDKVSVALYTSVFTWRDIRGMQMAGEVKQVRMGLEAVRAIRVYLEKFPSTKEFFSSGEPIDLETFGKRFRVRLYKFLPDFVYYLDNRISFGFRVKLNLT